MRASGVIHEKSTFAFSLVFIGSIISYIGGVAQAVGYILALSGLAILSFVWPMVSRIRMQSVFVLCMGMLLLSLISMLVAAQYAKSMSMAVQSVMYPVVLALLLAYGWRILNADQMKLANLLACVGLLNASVALLASTGIVTSWPVLGDIDTGRYIFGTRLPSSAGFVLNVNYFSTTQGVIFLLYAWFLSNSRFSYSKSNIFVGGAVACKYYYWVIPRGGFRNATVWARMGCNLFPVH